MTGPVSTGDLSRPWFRRGRRCTAAASLAVVVAGAVTLTACGGASPAKHATPRPGSASSAPVAAAGCHPADTGQQIPQTAPAGIEWTIIKSVAVPTSRTAGPLTVQGDVARCFAHTPTGALIAASQINARHLLCDGWKRVTEQQVLPGPGRDAYEKRRAAYTGDMTDAGTYGQIAGYQFLTYTKDTAVIQYVNRFSDETMQVSVLTVIWSSGDWRLQLRPDGSETPTVQPVQSLDGFVPWRGV